MSDFTYLHTHSHYSLLDGLGKIRPMVEHVKKLGMDSLALTDHGAMYGVIELVKTCQEFGIKPIIGMEAYLAPKGHQEKRGKIDTNPRHLTLLAQNQAGYRNLILLSTKAHLEGFYYRPRIDYELLRQHQAGLIVLSGCMNGDIPQAILKKNTDEIHRLIEWHIDVFGKDRFYLEVQHHPNLPEQITINEELLRYAKQYNLSAVATCDSHYIHPQDNEAQDVLVCVQTGKTVQEKNRLCMLGEDYSLPSPDFIKEAWKDHPSVVTNTQKIAELCQVELDFKTTRLPHYPLPPGRTADEELRSVCYRALDNKYLATNNVEQAKQRLDYELDVINKTGFASYFLIVADFVNEAKRRGILVGPGRGSAAGSIVSYLTNITGLDPIHYNLLFERFLNPERVSMPDIDLDFADDRRDEVIDYVRKKYGRDHVAQIITFGTMAARAAIRDTGRALGFPYAFCDKVAKSVPPFATFAEALQNGELKEMYDADPQAARLINTAMKLEGVCRHASTHAAGVVITEEPLTNHVPLQYSTTGGKDEQQIVTQYAMNHIESLGLLKMDFLGLKNLTIIQNTLSIIKERHGLSLVLDQIPLDDQTAYRLLQAGQTTGVFQLESSGMKRYLKELKPTEFEDIISMVALYRPGPMDSLPDFIAAKHGRKKISYLHPILEPILKKTYGIIVTQDQVLEIAREFAGFSYAEADILRKAVGKKILKLLVEQREKFISGAINHGINSVTAKKVWDFIEPFARYGFNRAHAACYAMIAYQTAYLKANYLAEFMAALLTSDEGNTERQAVEITEAISLGLKVLPPDINTSGHDFTVSANTDNQLCIRFGLSAIKNVGDSVVSTLIAERQESGSFTDIHDVFRRLRSKDFNRKSVESLARAGAFDALTERRQVLENMDKLLEFNRALQHQAEQGQQGLFGAATVSLPTPRVSLASVPPATKDECLAWEKELMGLYLSEHPFNDLQIALQGLITPLSEFTSHDSFTNGTTARVAGIITRVKKIITKSQRPMLFVQLEDMTGKIELLVFPALLEKSADFWVDGSKVMIQGKTSDKDGETKILADKVWPANAQTIAAWQSQPAPVLKSSPTIQSAKRLVIQLSSALPLQKVENLRDVLAKNNVPGDSTLAVDIIINRNGQLATVKTKYYLPREENITARLAELVGQNALRFDI